MWFIPVKPLKGIQDLFSNPSSCQPGACHRVFLTDDQTSVCFSLHICNFYLWHWVQDTEKDFWAPPKTTTTATFLCWKSNISTWRSTAQQTFFSPTLVWSENVSSSLQLSLCQMTSCSIMGTSVKTLGVAGVIQLHTFIQYLVARPLGDKLD